MMILRSAPASPFGRKVRIAISLLGLDNDVKIEAADTSDASDSLRKQNPLGKIPVVIAEDGTAYYNSRVILDYLDDRAGGGKIVPRDAKARLAALRLQALCDGILDASILTIYETRWRKAEAHEPKWLEHQAGKVARALAALEAAPPPLDATPNPAQRRADHARLHARLSRFPLQRHLARRSPPPRRLARSIRRARAGICGDQAGGLIAGGARARSINRGPCDGRCHFSFFDRRPV